jgi:hypothetical protein
MDLNTQMHTYRERDTETNMVMHMEMVTEMNMVMDMGTEKTRKSGTEF